MLLLANSVCWVITLNTPKWDILATDVAVYFNNNLRKLKLQIYQSIRLAKVRKKPPANVQNRENKVWREREFPLLNKNIAQTRSRTKLCKIHTRMTEPPNQFNQLLGIGASQAYKIIHFGKINCRCEHFRFSSILSSFTTWFHRPTTPKLPARLSFQMKKEQIYMWYWQKPVSAALYV